MIGIEHMCHISGVVLAFHGVNMTKIREIWLIRNLTVKPQYGGMYKSCANMVRCATKFFTLSARREDSCWIGLTDQGLIFHFNHYICNN